MANLAAAKQLISKRGVAPPTGIAPGSPEYDQWANAWMEGAIDAGDPEAVKAAGGRSAEGATGTYSAGGIADFGGAADPSSWMGQRAPTPRELRKMAQMQGWSEDFARFDDRQLAAWIGKSWDVGSNAFRNAYGDLVEKPTESGANTPAGMTGEGAGGFGGGGGGGGGKAGTSAASGALYSPLQAMLEQQGSYLGQYDPTKGDEKAGIRGGLVGGGGIWYQPTQQPTAAPAAPGTLPGGQGLTGLWTGQQSTSTPRTTGATLPTRAGSAGSTGGMLTNASPLTQTMTGLQSTAMPTSSTQSLLIPSSMQGGGYTGNLLTGGLTNMMANRQATKKKAIGSWF